MVIKKRSTPAKGVSVHDEAISKWAATDTIDCTGMNLKTLLNKAVENDMQEVVMRVSMFDSKLDPAQYQAIVRFNDATRPWAGSLGKDPHQTLMAALYNASNMPAPKEKQRTIHATKDSTGLLRKPTDAGVSRPAGKAGIKSRPKLRRP